MKRLSIFIAFIGLSLTASAQLKVDSLGKVYIQKDADSKRVSLSVGNNPNSNLEDDYGIDSKFGLNVQTHDSGQKDFCIGILSEANLTRTDGHAIGVWGQGTGTQNNNFGVLGTINPYQNGAGICGTTEGGYPPPFQGYYAGYFYGDTYVDGSLTTCDFYNLSDIRLKTNILPLEKSGTRQDRTLDKIQSINVITYNLKRPTKGENASERRTKYDEKRHYGVSAQELREIFPNLVQEGQDGYLAVSYTEMVPLLLQCIKELKQEVDKFKKTN